MVQNTQKLPENDVFDEPQEHHPTYKIHLARLLLCVLLIILLFFFGKNGDLVQYLALFIAFLSINFFEPLFSIIDMADPVIIRCIRPLRTFLRLSRVRHLPRVGRVLKRFWHVISYSILILLIVGLSFHVALGDWINNERDTLCFNTAASSSLCNSGIGVTPLADGVRIGLITNNDYGPFDDLINLNKDEIIVEKHIFTENETACSGPHITLAVVTILSRTIEDPTESASAGLDNLHGAYLAQHDYNAKRANYDPAMYNGQAFTSLCLVIANLGTLVTASKDSSTSGTDLYALPQVIKQIVQFKLHDNTFRGIIGLPYSTQVSEAISELQALGQTDIPIVSPSATSNKLSNVKNFYRVSSPDQRQGEAMAAFACTYLMAAQHAPSVDIFSDSSDTYSSSLSTSFDTKIQNCLSQQAIEHIQYQNGNAPSIQHATADALHKQDSFIFFPGYATDIGALEAQLQSGEQASSNNVTVLGGDGLDDITNLNDNTFSSIYESLYATPLNNSDATSKSFVSEFKLNFSLPYLADAIPGYTLLPQGVIRTYNATEAFTATLNTLIEHGQFDMTQDEIDTYLASIQFDGIDNHFTFQGDTLNSNYISDPAPLPVYIMCTDRTHGIRLVAKYSGDNKITMLQGLCS